MRSEYRLLILWGIVAVLQGCASSGSVRNEEVAAAGHDGDSQVIVVPAPGEESDEEDDLPPGHERSAAIESEKQLKLIRENPSSAIQHSSLTKGVIQRNGLGVFTKINLQVEHADVRLVAGQPVRKGKLNVALLRGRPECNVRVSETDGVLDVVEAPGEARTVQQISGVGKSGRSSVPDAKCHFEIEMELSESAELSVDLKRGSIFLEQWPRSAHLKLGWGEVAVGNAGALVVECGRCTLTGEEIDGPVRFQLESGNVGLAGLSSSVEGQTLGDAVLKWKKVRPKAEVKVVSRAGDAILFFPSGVPLSLELQAPRGDVSSKVGKENHQGVPVSVTAQAGNVRVYRVGKAP
ncbi:MAG: hypothetical protein AB1540_05610 [Bdellovibrionota bacterium]